MGLFDMFSSDPIKSTAAWGAMSFKKISKNNWKYAEENKKAIFIYMIRNRPGTPDQVESDIKSGVINSLSDLCSSIILYEAISVDPNDILPINNQVRNILLNKSIPEVFL